MASKDRIHHTGKFYMKAKDSQGCNDTVKHEIFVCTLFSRYSRRSYKSCKIKCAKINVDIIKNKVFYGNFLI